MAASARTLFRVTRAIGALLLKLKRVCHHIIVQQSQPYTYEYNGHHCSPQLCNLGCLGRCARGAIPDALRLTLQL